MSAPGPGARHLYRLLLRLYPRRFREENAREMEDAFSRLLARDGDRDGLGGQVRCWLGATLDALRTGPPMWFRPEVPGSRKGSGEFMESVFSDVRFAVRSLLRRPVFAVTAIGTLALGIGANASMFTVVSGLLLTPLPYDEPGELVTIFAANPELGWSHTDVSPSNAWDWRERSRALEDLVVFDDETFNLTGDGPPELVRAIRATPNVFRVLGRVPAMGRDFREDEFGEGRDKVAVLTHGFWTRRLGQGADVVGAPLRLDGEQYIVVGVLPEDFVFLDERPDLFVPLDFHPGDIDRDSHSSETVARLADGIGLTEARIELTQIAAQMEEEYPETNAGWTIEMQTIRMDLLGSVALQASIVLMGAVGFILLMACVNVANLLLARAGSRHRELSVRSALGAGRMRVLRQLLTESLVLGLAGGALGLLIGVWGSRGITAALPSDMPPVFRYGIDAGVLGFVAGITVAAVLVFGLTPALHTVRRGGDALRHGGRTGSGRRLGRFGDLLVVMQTGLAMVLLVGGGLLMKSIVQMRTQNFGFDAQDVLTIRIAPPVANYPEGADRVAFWNAVEGRVAGLGEVAEVGSTQSHPLMGSNWANTVRLASEEDRELTVRTTYASPGYLDAVGARVVEGRSLQASDDELGAPVALVNEAFARRYLSAGISPTTQSLLRGDGTEIAIVGVVADMIERDVDRPPEPAWYLPANAAGLGTRSLVVRSTSPPAELLPRVQQAVWSVDPAIPLYEVETLEDLVQRRVGGFALIANLMGAFALLALTLGAVGIYGVTAFSAAQRTSEIGLRKALGAEEGQVVGMVVRKGAIRAAIGLVLGLGGALAVANLMGSLLVGVSPRDPTVFVVVSLVLGGVSVLGLYLPARRAARVDPVQALSAE